MALSARVVARVTFSMEVDATALVKVRGELSPEFATRSGVRLSYNDLLICAVARTLEKHAELNSRWTDQGMYILDAINVGLAVAVEDGLVVPVIRDAHRKSLAEISAELARLTIKAREDRLSAEEMTGGTFTVTNLGMFGIDSFTPLVNPPETAILGVGRIAERPAARNGQLVLRPTMYLSLSVDHRAVDGAPAARFLQSLRACLEDPQSLH
jgi:pyruvate dehydrogenase E2 component (dihydrolipoyllysine-residue acetyltransferase)